MRRTIADGFCPADSRVILAAEDFGAVWMGLVQSDAWTSLCREMRDPSGPIVLAVRKGSGVRPTPMRWTAWMGNRFLASESPEGMGVCVYPGLLLRAANRLRATFGSGTDADGIGKYGEYSFAWRERFCLISTSRAWVCAALRDPAPKLAESLDTREIRLFVPAAHEAVIRLTAKDGWPVSGQIHVATRSRKAPLTSVNAWPDPPICSITAPRWSDVQNALGLLEEPLRRLPCWYRIEEFSSEALRRWGLGALPRDWEEQNDECGLALVSVDTSGAIPVPSLALLLKNAAPQTKSHPLASLLTPLAPAPYEWNGQHGVAASILGESVNLCLCRSGAEWLATSNEPLMAQLAGRLHNSDGVDADLAIRLNWKKVSVVVGNLLQNAAAYDLLPSMNKADLDVETMPAVKAVACLGTLQLDGQNQGTILKFSGFLAHAPARQESSTQ